VTGTPSVAVIIRRPAEFLHPTASLGNGKTS
jgi:hypothetical protein